MSDFDWIRLICRLLDVLERRLVPWSMYCAGALAVGVRSLPEKFRFRPPAGQSFLETLNHYGGFSCKILPLNQLGNSFAMVDTP